MLQNVEHCVITVNYTAAVTLDKARKLYLLHIWSEEESVVQLLMCWIQTDVNKVT